MSVFSHRCPLQLVTLCSLCSHSSRSFKNSAKEGDVLHVFFALLLYSFAVNRIRAWGFIFSKACSLIVITVWLTDQASGRSSSPGWDFCV